MIKDIIYLPIMKAKQAEFDALMDMNDVQKNKTLPLFDILPPNGVSLNDDEDNQITPENIEKIEKHLLTFIEKLHKCFGNERYSLVDLELIQEFYKLSDGKHPLTFVFEAALKKHLQVIPVIGLNRPEHYNKAVIDIIKNTNKVCLRLEKEDLDYDLSKSLDSMLHYLNIIPENVIFLIDFKSIEDESFIKIILPQLSKLIPYFDRWEMLSFTCSSFPKSTSNIELNIPVRIIRKEWSIYNDIKRHHLQRNIIFGDYNIINPEFIEINNKYMSGSTKIIYTIDNEWIIIKGLSFKKTQFNYELIRPICKTITELYDFKGRDFSIGDEWIEDCANNKTSGPGNATTWLKAGISHHIAFVLNQLANSSS